MSLVNSLWRAVAVYRLAAFGYAVVVMTQDYRVYQRPVLGWTVIAVMGGWSVIAGFAYQEPRRRTWALFTADALIGIGCLGASRPVVGAHLLAAGGPTVPMAWIAAPVVAAALFRGQRLAAGTALLIGGADVGIRGRLSEVAINETVLLLLAGLVIGYAASLAVDAEERTQRAAQIEAAARERERLARSIHDSVLQVLAMVQRRSVELGGDAAELGRLAGEQEATLRALVSSTPDALGHGGADLRGELARFAAPHVSLASPATAVPLPRTHVVEVGAAVGAALDNVRAHCPPGTRVWVLVEDEASIVRVTVRDEGPGFDHGRLAEAAAAGRLGVARSICGRVRDLGGTAAVRSWPGGGTEVELSIRAPLRTATESAIARRGCERVSGMGLDLAQLFAAPTYRAMDLDDAGRTLITGDESGSAQLAEVAPDGTCHRPDRARRRLHGPLPARLAGRGGPLRRGRQRAHPDRRCCASTPASRSRPALDDLERMVRGPALHPLPGRRHRRAAVLPDQPPQLGRLRHRGPRPRHRRGDRRVRRRWQRSATRRSPATGAGSRSPCPAPPPSATSCSWSTSTSRRARRGSARSPPPPSTPGC